MKNHAVRIAREGVPRNAGMIAITAETGADALEVLEDIRMPAMMGTELLARMKAARHPAKVIMMTASADLALKVSLVKAARPRS